MKSINLVFISIILTLLTCLISNKKISNYDKATKVSRNNNKNRVEINIHMSLKSFNTSKQNQIELKNSKCINKFALAPINPTIKPKPTKLPKIDLNYSNISGEVQTKDGLAIIVPSTPAKGVKAKPNSLIFTNKKNEKHNYSLEKVLFIPAGKNFNMIFIHTLNNTNEKLYPYNMLNIIFQVIPTPKDSKTNTEKYLSNMLEGFTTEGEANITKINENMNLSPYFSYSGTSAFKDCVQNSIWVQVEKKITLSETKFQSAFNGLKEKSEGLDSKSNKKTSLNEILQKGTMSNINWRILWYYDHNSA